jgi:hypothetical protein
VKEITQSADFTSMLDNDPPIMKIVLSEVDAFILATVGDGSFISLWMVNDDCMDANQAIKLYTWALSTFNFHDLEKSNAEDLLRDCLNAYIKGRADSIVFAVLAPTTDAKSLN